MKCPYCHKTINLPSYAYGNADQYHNTVHTATNCCGNIVMLTPIRRYEVCKSWKEIDDWGQEKTTGVSKQETNDKQ